MRVTVTCPSCQTNQVLFDGNVIRALEITFDARAQCPICESQFRVAMTIERDNLTSVRFIDDDESENEDVE